MRHDDAIRSANQQFMQAFAAGDAAKIAALYTKDGRALPPGAETVSGAAGITALWQMVLGMGIKRAQLETGEVDSVTDSTAIEVGKYTLFLDGDTVADHGKYIVVWRREGDQWKLHRDIWNTSKSA